MRLCFGFGGRILNGSCEVYDFSLLCLTHPLDQRFDGLQHGQELLCSQTFKRVYQRLITKRLNSFDDTLHRDDQRAVFIECPL